MKLPTHVQKLRIKLRTFWDVDHGQRETYLYNAGGIIRKILHSL